MGREARGRVRGGLSCANPAVGAGYGPIARLSLFRLFERNDAVGKRRGGRIAEEGVLKYRAADSVATLAQAYLPLCFRFVYSRTRRSLAMSRAMPPWSVYGSSNYLYKAASRAACVTLRLNCSDEVENTGTVLHQVVKPAALRRVLARPLRDGLL